MKAIPLSTWLSRFFAVSLLLFALTLSGLLILGPLFSVFSNLRERQSALEGRLEHYERLASELPRLRTRSEQMQAENGSTVVLWIEDTPDLAAAAIQTFIMQSAGAYQVQVTTIQTLPPAMEQSLEKLAVRVELTTTMTGLQRLLYTLESHLPALFIQSLAIRSLEPGAAVTEPPKEPTLAVRAEIVGYRLSNSDQPMKGISKGVP